MPDSVQLFGFQTEAADALRQSALSWIDQCARIGPPRYGSAVIPYMGQLKAITGSGKTPMLADVVSGIGDAVVLWTSRHSAVVDQTYQNLQGKYRSLLAGSAEVNVVRRVQTQRDWRALIDSERGLTIWLLTVGLWNEAEASQGAGSEDARLTLHRPHPDWAGATSPWEQLRSDLRRPLWIVSDESHNQSTTQLDQLAALRPKGFFMASATPVANELFLKWRQVLEEDEAWQPLVETSTVGIRTRDVVEACLLKTTLKVEDFNSGTEENLDGALAALATVEAAARDERAPVTPRAVYVVEESNVRRGSTEEARPVAIWKYLRSRGVPADEIAVYTQTRDLPEGAEQVSSLARLHPRYRHIIFNMSLQEGWDDPEAYVCYFDGVTRSYNRIKQIVGRVLRQPNARRYSSEALNTATLIVNTPGGAYETVIEELEKELRLYASDDDPGFVPVRVKTRSEPLEPLAVKAEYADLEVSRWQLRRPDMRPVVTAIRSTGARPWPDSDREAKGIGQVQVFDLEEERLLAREYMEVLRSARTRNGEYLRRRISKLNRSAAIAVDGTVYSGVAFDQYSCAGSTVQSELDALAQRVVDHYEAHVAYTPEVDPVRTKWRPGEHRPRRRDLKPYANALHASYSPSDFSSNDEREFAEAIDRIALGPWMRNPATPGLGYSIPLPARVGESFSFYPDFIWWLKDATWAIDTTGKHLLDEKLKGKLFALDDPRFALVTRGEVSASGSIPGSSGWTLVTSRGVLAPEFDHHTTLGDLLTALSAKPLS